MSAIPMEIATVRQRLLAASVRARTRAQERRARHDAAGRAYLDFLARIASPLLRQIAAALKAEGRHFTVFTPGDGLKLALDSSRDDYVEFALDTSGDAATVVLRVSQTRGSRTLLEEQHIRMGAAPEDLTDEEVLAALLTAMEPWLER